VARVPFALHGDGAGIPTSGDAHLRRG
jgi:hypothetical protein